MKKDRLRDNTDRIHKLDDLIAARDRGASHLSEDSDSLSDDLDIPEDTDVDEALTFPHPRHKKSEEIELMDTPNVDDMDEDWEDQDILPSDYQHYYDEATSTDARDEPDEVAEDQIHTIDHLSLSQTAPEPEIETMPNIFTPEEEP